MRYHPRVPLIGLALSFIAGTWLGLNRPLHLLLIGGAASLVTLGTVLAWCTCHGRLAIVGGVGIHLLSFLAAATNADLHTWHASAPALDSLPILSGTRIELTGIVADEPADVIADARPMWRFPLDVSEVRLSPDTDWRPVAGTVRITWYGDRRGRFPQYGDRWEVAGRLTMLTNNPSGNPIRRPLQFLTTGARNAKFLADNQGSPSIQYCLDARNSARRVLNAGIEHHTNDVAVLNSLLLGYRSQMPQEIHRAYARTGTLHIFAISGSHVVILAALIVFVLSLFRIPRTRWVLFVGPLLVFYTVMTGLQPSAVRACIMAIVFLLAPLLGRKSAIFSALAFSAILILAVAPSDLLNIGFILSFTAMIGIILLYPICIRPLQRLFQPDPLRLQPESPVVHGLRVVWREFSLLLATSTAAWLVSTPLTAYYFQIFSPIALVGNLLAIPLASLIIVTGSLSLVTGSCVPVLAEIFNHANLVLASWLTGSMGWLASIPGAWLQVPAPSPWLIASTYVTLALLVMEARRSGGPVDTAPDPSLSRPPAKPVPP